MSNNLTSTSYHSQNIAIVDENGVEYHARILINGLNARLLNHNHFANQDACFSTVPILINMRHQQTK